MEITEQGVQPQKSDQRKVAQHFIQWMSAKLSSDKVGIFTSGIHLQLFVNVRFINHGVENIQNLKKYNIYVVLLWNEIIFVIKGKDKVKGVLKFV